jgi:hypothetical protein
LEHKLPRRIRVLTPENAVNMVRVAILGKADLVDGKLPSAQLPALSKSLVGLGNVDNTADASKPLSSAAVTALAAKADQGATTAALAAKADAAAVYTKAQVDDKVGSGVGASPIRLWDKSARTWPAVGSGSAPVVFMSTNDKTADVPTGMRVELDVWIPHVDATNA